MEVLAVVSPFLQFVAQNADSPVPGARGVPGYGGLQGFSHIRVFFFLTGRSLAFQSQRVVSRFSRWTDPGTAAGSMSFSHCSLSKKCGGRQEFECGGASALELNHVGVSAAVHRSLPMTSTSSSVGCQWDQARQRYCWWVAAEDGSRLGKVIWRPPWAVGRWRR